jgi:hypothetical protein
MTLLQPARQLIFVVRPQKRQSKKGHFVMGLLIQVGMLTLAAYAAYCDEAAQVTGDASPEFVTVLKLDKDKGILTYRILTLKEEQQTVTQEENGKRVKRTFLSHVNYQADREVSLRGARVYDSKGRRLGQATALKRLSAGGMILKSADGNKVNARYLRAIREDVLIMVLPVVERVLIAEENLPKGK